MEDVFEMIQDAVDKSGYIEEKKKRVKDERSECLEGMYISDNEYIEIGPTHWGGTGVDV